MRSHQTHGKIRCPAARAWLAPAGVLVGTGWGSNQLTPLLLVYEHRLALNTGTAEAIFGVYALGLIPGLLLAGPASDARGRRVIVLPAAGLSLAASVVLAAAGHHLALLFLGRLMAGVSSGAVFAAGTAWLRETSLPPRGTATAAQAARRAVIAMTVGFALGPLVSGVLAQWAPLPTVVPYLPHITLMAVVIVSLTRTPETAGETKRRMRLSVPAVRRSRFRQIIVPLAPWVFAAPSVAFALLPSIVGADHDRDRVALAAAVTMLTALAGVLIQPVARRLDTHGARNRSAITGLVVLAAGLGLGALTAHDRQVWLLVPCAVVLGSAYGMCFIAGLVEVAHLADHDALAGLTAVYYALTYVGLSAPYLLTLASHLTAYPNLLLISAALALATAASLTRHTAVLQGSQLAKTPTSPTPDLPPISDRVASSAAATICQTQRFPLDCPTAAVPSVPTQAATLISCRADEEKP